MTDVVIAGGGPAGSALALQLGQQGLEVELYERSRFPREKPCGEGLMPAGVAALRRLGVHVPGAPFRGVRYHFREVSALGLFPAGDGFPAAGLGIRRKHLDATLFRAAAECAGVRAVSGVRVEGPVLERGGVSGVLVEGDVRRARLVVAADGANSVLRNKLDLNVPARRKRLGVRAHFRLPSGSSAADCVEVFFGAGHELYVTPLPDHELLVASLADARWYAGSPEEAFRRAIQNLPRLANRLAGAEQITELAGTSPLTGGARVGVLPGLVLLGDAAGFADPITGGGMTQALLSADLLAEYLDRRFPPRPEDLERFDRERQGQWRDYHRLTRMVLWLADRPRLGAGALGLLGTWPGLFSHLIAVSGGERRFLPGLRLLSPRKGGPRRCEV